MLTTFILWAFQLCSVAYASCDELERVLKETLPKERIQRFLEEPICSLKNTKFAETLIFPYIEANDDGFVVLVRALEWGMTKEADEWLLGLLPNERMQMLMLLGRKCTDTVLIQEFLFFMYQQHTHIFWGDRWDMAIRSCSTPNFREEIKKQIDKGGSQGEHRFWGILATYIHQDPEGARVFLKDSVRSSSSVEEREKFLPMYEVFAQISTKEELKRDIEEDLSSFVDVFPSAYAMRLRSLLQNLGAYEKANSLARFQYAEQFASHNALIWGGMVLETVLCTNNLYQQRVHTVLISDTEGTLWADQLESLLQEHSSSWTFSLSKKCKGTEERSYLTPEIPFRNDEEWMTWIEKQTKGDRKNPKMIVNFQTIEEPPLSFSRKKEPPKREASE